MVYDWTTVLIIKGTVDATLKLVCPHCHKTQLRAKKPAGAVYVCKKCRKHFRREDSGAPRKSRR
jgi:transposase-like protein